jgi:formate dehydrogenase maturation protein FdhE
MGCFILRKERVGMLSKKRIEAAMECEDISYFYNSKIGQDETLKFINLLAQTALAHMTMLKKLEWISSDNGTRHKFCPICGGWNGEHKPGCELAALLKSGEVEG